MVCDLDEFIYSRTPFCTISSYLDSLPISTSQVLIQWKLFGSSGNKRQPASIINGFRKRALYNTRKNGMLDDKIGAVKSIVRSTQLKRFAIHQHPIAEGDTITSDNSKCIECQNGFQPTSEAILADSYLHLNHYAIQAYEWFMEVKCTRGDVSNQANNTVRNESYFKSYDYFDIDDNELAEKRGFIYGA